MSRTEMMRFCKHCGKLINGFGVQCESVPNEGCSIIKVGERKYFDVDDSDFCDLECFIKELRKVLE